MLYVDHRTYTFKPLKMGKWLALYEEAALPVQLKYLGKPLGAFTSAVGPLNQFTHLWGFDDMGEFERRHAARDKDPDWPAYLQASEHLIMAQETRLIRRVEMMSLKGQ